MPTIINGCGTWYCGKRRIHRVKASCSSCNAFGELESYDTTLYFVIFMIPIVPLGAKRILESCPFCQRHRIVSLKNWEASKANAFNSILEKLKANPDDRETIQSALGLATVYQDERLFDKLADALAGHRTDDWEIQFQLGGAYEYFSRWSDAEDAYRRALNLQPDDDNIKERLAVALLKQFRPEEAAKYVQHAFESKDPNKAWLTYWLVDGFMAKGSHDEALRIMDVRDELFPKLARDKAYQTQRKNAEKNKRTGKPVRSTVLAESAKAGFREGSGLGFKWPKYVAAGIFLGLIALYLGVAFYRGENRQVYLVNGWTKPYTVTVNGEQHQLIPGAAKKITVPEGDVTIDWPDGGEGPKTVQVETSFFGRPFNRPVFVINPDQLALIGREETIYSSEQTAPDKAPDVRTGQLLQRFEDVHYEFEPFPTEIKAKQGSKITKTRVGIVTTGATQDRLVRAMTLLPHEQLVDYTKRLIQLNPDDELALMFLASHLPQNQMLDYLRPRLADRPVRVEWHRIYQSLMEVAEPDKDIRPEYRRLIDETKRDAKAVYLLGRLEDGPEGDKLYKEAAAANPPVPHACAGLGFRHLARGEFDLALEWMTKARELAPLDVSFRKRYLDSLVAAGKHAELLKASTSNDPTEIGLYFRYRLAAYVAMGELGAIEAEINRAAIPPGSRASSPAFAQAAAQYRVELEMVLAEVRGDRAQYLELANRSTNKEDFVVHLLRGEHLKSAAANAKTEKVISVARDWEVNATRSGLLYLAGLKAKDAPFAETHWKAFAESLNKGDRAGRMLGAIADGKQAFDWEKVKDSSINPSTKRIVLAAFAKKFPQNAKELGELAKKLDFDRDEYSLCLRYVME